MGVGSRNRVKVDATDGGESSVKRKQGAAGVLTGGVIDREDALLAAVARSLGPFVAHVYDQA